MSDGVSVDVNPFGFDLSKGIISGSVAEFVEFGDKFGKERLDSLLSISRTYAELSKSCVSLQYAYSRSNSGGSSVSKGSSVSSTGLCGKSVGAPITSGLAKSRYEAVRSIKTWRQSTIPDGFCYSKLMRSEVKEELFANLGPHPTLATLCRQSEKSFLPVSALANARFIDRPKGVHVTLGGDDGCLALCAIKSYVAGAEVLPGSFGAAVRDLKVVPSDRKYAGFLRVGSNRVFKKQVEFGEVVVDVGCISGSPAFRLSCLDKLLQDVPDVYDCLDVQESGLGVVSCSVRQPSAKEIASFSEVFSGYLPSVVRPGVLCYKYEPVSFDRLYNDRISLNSSLVCSVSSSREDFKKMIGYGKVVLDFTGAPKCFGFVNASNSFLGFVPPVYDCYVMRDNGWGYLSSSFREPTDTEVASLARLVSAFSAIKYCDGKIVCA